jgi:indolepyruvate ferredoxin oxidoreductase
VRNYFALLAYKDEYEVARLHTETGFLDSLRRNFGARARPTFHFSPPLFAAKDPATGRPKKYEFGPWILPVLRLLAKLRGLRGTKLDPFGYTADRRLERELLARYERLVERLIAELDDRRFDIALELARLPADVRGYGPIKKAAAERAAEREKKLVEAWEAPPTRVERPARASAA